MHVEWQGDHKMLSDDEKQDFERELKELGLDPSKFLVEVRREPGVEGAEGSHAIRYNIFVSDLAHPDRDTWSFYGGHFDWIEQFRKRLLSHR